MIRTITTTVLLLLFCTLNAFAQPARATINVSGQQANNSIRIPLANPQPFLAFSAVWKGQEGTLNARFSPDGERWGNWVALGMDGHAEQSSEKYVSELHFAPAGSQWVEVQPAIGMENLVLHFFNPGRTDELERTGYPPAITERSPVYCPCDQPDFEGREDWCPDGTCPPDATPVGTNPTHLIIHHAAGTNSSNDWAAVVRAIWDFHTGVNGWDDVGYNWLIDPNGVLYEGRGDDRLGAHFCGTNGATMGVCMLGDYTSITPTAAARGTLAHLMAWKSCDIGVDPLGTAFHSNSGLQLMRISGHRDGCATACPGDAFYPQLPDVRNDVVDFIANQCAAIAPPRDLTAGMTADTAVLLEWVDESDNETAFLIERANSFFGTYVQIGEAPANATTYEDFDIEIGTGYYYQVRATTGTDTSLYTNKAFVFTNVVSTDNLLQGQTVQVFPNPTSGALQLHWATPFDGQIILRVLDGRGAAVHHQQLAGQQLQHQLDLGTLPSGLYLIELTSKSEQAIYRVFKE
jgi:hypothetical protein